MGNLKESFWGQKNTVSTFLKFELSLSQGADAKNSEKWKTKSVWATVV